MSEQFNPNRVASAMADSIHYASDKDLMALCEALAGVIRLDAQQMFDAIGKMSRLQILAMCRRIARQQQAVAAMEEVAG